MATVSAVATVMPPPGQGAFWMTMAGVGADTFPTTGHSASATSGNALWDDLGLEPGKFEVVIERVKAYTATTLVEITEIGGSSSSIKLPSATNFGSMEEVDIPMRDGFTATTTGGGCEIIFRIHRYL